MTTPRKVQAVGDLQEKLGQATAIVLTDYRGLPTPELNQLRVRLRDAAAEMEIVKNTLLGIAAERTGIDGLGPLLQGPTAMTVTRDSEIQVARTLVDYIRTSRTVMKIKGGLIGREVITADQVQELAQLPPRQDLQSVLAGSIQGPLSGLVGLINSALSGFVHTLDQRAKQMGDS